MAQPAQMTQSVPMIQVPQMAQPAQMTELLNLLKDWLVGVGFLFSVL